MLSALFGCMKACHFSVQWRVLMFWFFTWCFASGEMFSQLHYWYKSDNRSVNFVMRIYQLMRIQMPGLGHDHVHQSASSLNAKKTNVLLDRNIDLRVLAVEDDEYRRGYYSILLANSWSWKTKWLLEDQFLHKAQCHSDLLYRTSKFIAGHGVEITANLSFTMSSDFASQAREVMCTNRMERRSEMESRDLQSEKSWFGLNSWKVNRKCTTLTSSWEDKTAWEDDCLEARTDDTKGTQGIWC